MTQPPKSMQQMHDEAIDAIKDAVTAVDSMRSDIARVEGKTDRRAKKFTILWALLAVALLAIVGVFVGFVIDFEHQQDAAGQRQQQADRWQHCFQSWANATADRSLTLSTASDTRIRALNNALDVIVDPHANPTKRTDALKIAAQAGDAYEQVARDNPPVPASRLDCT